MRTTPLLAAAAVVLLLTGCSSGSKPQEAELAPRDCIDVPSAIMDRIAEGANASPITPVEASGVRSQSFEDATIVAMKFTAADGTESTGAWAIGGTLEDPGMTLAVDAVAQAVTDWPGELNGQKLTVTEDGVAEASECLTARS